MYGFNFLDDSFAAMASCSNMDNSSECIVMNFVQDTEMFSEESVLPPTSTEETCNLLETPKMSGSQLVAPGTSKKRKKPEDEFFTTMTKCLKNITEEKDVNDLFGAYVAGQLKTVKCPADQELLRMKIQNLIYEFKYPQ
ncbi:uncharacterized protein LOC118199046 isoform X1 [Stegodyphus dumicola]|uniref:uncharacterized protein LOC118199046 isoform X1 n=1 Tax=Stegodyphus dumicola TaxID=202533 RepID=UPI0015AE3246|nr:uncharacterized protein LOC118199046 isoform X1 [Stegodyphus dumicola]